jgi:Skp family chaperone for outer membrane proteins
MFKKSIFMKKGFLMAAVLFMAVSFTNDASAQTKIGYFDDQFVLSLFPGIQKIDTLLQSYSKDSLQEEYNWTLKQYQVQDSVNRKDSIELSKKPKALEMATTELNKLKYKLINWQQYQQEMLQQKQEALLLPYRQKIYEALSEVVKENKYTLVLRSEVLSPYVTPSLADNLAIRTAIKLKLPVPKDYMDAFNAAIGVAPAAKPAAPKK